MQDILGSRPMRVTGTVQIELEDGRVAELDVDLDVSGHEAGYAIDNRFDDERHGRDAWWDMIRPTRQVGTAYTLYLPTPETLEESQRPVFTLRIPNEAS